jgi:hypothetical protein
MHRKPTMHLQKVKTLAFDAPLARKREPSAVCRHASRIGVLGTSTCFEIERKHRISDRQTPEQGVSSLHCATLLPTAA